MGIIGALVGLLKADSSAWKKGFGEARDEVTKTDAKSSDLFKSMKSKFGKGSELAQFGKILAGGGAIMGLTMIGKEIYNVADAWTGVTKAAEEAERVNKEYEATTKVIRMEQNRMASEQLQMQDKLRKAALDLDTARHPENKEKNTLQAQLDAADEALNKGVRAQYETAKKEKDIAVKAAQDADNEIARIQGERDAMKRDHPILNNPFAQKEWKRQQDELKKIYDENVQKGKEAGTRAVILKKELDKEIIQTEELKNSIFEKSHAAMIAEWYKQDEEAQKKLAEEAQQAAEEKIRLDKQAAQAAVRLKKQTLEDEKANLEETIRAGKAAEHYQLAQTTAVRGAAGTVWLPPNRPEVKAAQEAAASLKLVVEELKKMNRSSYGTADTDQSNPLY